MRAHSAILDLPRVEHPPNVRVVSQLMNATISTVTFWWNCPGCQRLHRSRVSSRMSRMSPRVQCKASDCRRTYGLGLAFWRVEGGGTDRFIRDGAQDDYRPDPVLVDEMVYGVRRRDGPVNVLLESANGSE